MYHLRHVSLLIFYLDDLSNDESGVLKSPAIIVLLLVSPFALYVEVHLCWVNMYLQLWYILLVLISWSLGSVCLCLL